MSAGGPVRLSAAPAPSGTEAFDETRPRLLRLAYRMLGSLADAEDIVQEAFLRWSGVPHGDVKSPDAYLTQVVTRLCLDHLRSARARREVYVGPWLPEPVVDHPDLISDGADADSSLDLNVGLLLALERLSPLERAAFLLFEAFDVDYDEVGRILDRTPAACRKLVERARAHVSDERPRYAVSREDGERLAAAFRQASQVGDLSELTRLLAADAKFVADGGGKRSSARNVIEGRERIVRFFAGLARKRAFSASFVPRRINGMPGFVSVEPDGLPQTMAIEIVDGLVVAIYVVRNPDKLQRIAVDGL